MVQIVDEVSVLPISMYKLKTQNSLKLNAVSVWFVNLAAIQMQVSSTFRDVFNTEPGVTNYAETMLIRNTKKS